MPKRRAPIAEPPAVPVSGSFPSTHPAYRRVYAVVRAIPRGRVATYGQVAMVAGYPGRARQVGYALRALPPGSGVPWQRVINSQGRISPRGELGAEDLQRALLEDEGVAFSASGRVDFARFGWRPAMSKLGRGRARRG